MNRFLLRADHLLVDQLITVIRIGIFIEHRRGKRWVFRNYFLLNLTRGN